MVVLVVHNHYKQPGGEDQVFTAECALLQARGHRVHAYTVHNREVDDSGYLRLAGKTMWNGAAYRDLRAEMKRSRPDVVHFHNTVPLISPAGYYAAKAEGIPVVQTLHNYRLYCANGLFFRDGRVCEDCVDAIVPWPAVSHGCYRESRAASGVVAAMLGVHRALGTWRRQVDLFVTLSSFSRDVFVRCGLPPSDVVIKPNFLQDDPGVGDGSGGYVLYVGRLSPEKGVTTFLSAQGYLDRESRSVIVGDGPLAEQVARAARDDDRLDYRGSRSQSEVMELIGKAALVVVPSLCYENFPRVIVESFARGTPVIAADSGALCEFVDHGKTGRHFRSGDPVDLAKQVEIALSDGHASESRRSEVRREFEANYTADRNYDLLLKIYEKARERNLDRLERAK